MAIGFAAGPAAAANVGIQLPSGRGTMTFIDDGDDFRVCDTKADSEGVTGQVRKLTTGGDIIVIATISDGGDAGCGWATDEDLIGTWPHDMRLCWHGGGCVVSPVIRESD